MSVGDRKYHVTRRVWVDLIRPTPAGWIVSDGASEFFASELFLLDRKR